MSGRRRRPAPRFALVAAATFVSLGANADAPDAEFLEYLGSWESSDEDWVVLLDKEVTDGAEGETRSETADEEAESREHHDDS